jgi:hypothetical protein
VTDERIAEIMGWAPIEPDEAMTAALRADLLTRLRRLAREAAQEALQGVDVLAEYSGQGGVRQWAYAASWLTPGQKIVVVDGC